MEQVKTVDKKQLRKVFVDIYRLNQKITKLQEERDLLYDIAQDQYGIDTVRNAYKLFEQGIY